MSLDIEIVAQLVLRFHSFPVVVIGNVAVQTVVRSEVVEQILLVIIGREAQPIQWSPVQDLVGIKRILRIVGVGIRQTGVVHVTVKSQRGRSYPVQAYSIR